MRVLGGRPLEDIHKSLRGRLETIGLPQRLHAVLLRTLQLRKQKIVVRIIIAVIRVSCLQKPLEVCPPAPRPLAPAEAAATAHDRVLLLKRLKASTFPANVAKDARRLIRRDAEITHEVAHHDGSLLAKLSISARWDRPRRRRFPSRAVCWRRRWR